MKALVLKTYRITDIQFQNHAVANGKTKLETKYTYQVKFGNNNTCRAEMKVTVSDQANPDTLKIDITLVGIFEIDRFVSKIVRHLERRCDGMKEGTTRPITLAPKSKFCEVNPT